MARDKKTKNEEAAEKEVKEILSGMNAISDKAHEFAEQMIEGNTDQDFLDCIDPEKWTENKLKPQLCHFCREAHPIPPSDIESSGVCKYCDSEYHDVVDTLGPICHKCKCIVSLDKEDADIWFCPECLKDRLAEVDSFSMRNYELEKANGILFFFVCLLGVLIALLFWKIKEDADNGVKIQPVIVDTQEDKDFRKKKAKESSDWFDAFLEEEGL